MGTGLAWGGGFLRRGSIGDRGIGGRGERRRNISILSPIGTAPGEKAFRCRTTGRLF